MAKKKTIIDLVNDMEASVRDAFIESIHRATSRIDFDLLVSAIERQDTGSALRMFGLSKEHFEPMDKAIRDAYEAGGTWVAEELQKMANHSTVSGSVATNQAEIETP